ncbi:hypothetical protein EG68_06941 [Paragonimus skrjabini miyazakii]|uniref:Transmembrane protein 8A n=1 Tax=Paragonimus skrjabini miyazakii TaxID=59628 RepID=A0A8S9YNB0_9TREM|nr:hypothetical protein EG68_06941 [Paragonimus skrjabini miyazakii]
MVIFKYQKQVGQSSFSPLSCSISSVNQAMLLCNFLRPLSLPVVTPFHVGVPLGVQLLPDTYCISVGLTQTTSAVSILNATDDQHMISVISSKQPDAASIEVHIHSPTSGAWFFGVYFIDLSKQTTCIASLFPQVTNELVTNISPVVLSVTHSGQIRHSTLIQHSNTDAFSRTFNKSTASERASNSELVRGLSSRTPLPGGDQTVDPTIKRQSEASNRLVLLSKRVNPQHVYRPRSNLLRFPRHTIQDQMHRSESLGSPLLTIELAPSEGRLYKILIVDGMTSVDISIETCSLLPPILISSATPTVAPNSNPSSAGQPNVRMLRSEAPSHCPILLDAGLNAIPKKFARFSRQSPELFGNLSAEIRRENALLSSSRSRKRSLLHKRYRFDALRAPSLSHYIYLRNLHDHGTLKLTLTLKSNFDCSSAYQSDHSLSGNYNSQYSSLNNKRLSHLSSPSILYDTVNRNATESSPYRQALPKPAWIRSLLPWVNPQWPELTRFGKKSQYRRSGPELHTNISLADVFVDPDNPVHQALERCVLWKAPSRVSKMHAFAYHFTFQPESSQYTNGLHLHPWNVIAIPVYLDSRLDTGGSLEISLQLNALDVAMLVNATHSKPLPRHVILHACFARHPSTSPYDFTNLKRCPLWIRLATSHGVAVSVAHAVFNAVSEALYESQPPHRSEMPPSFDTSFNVKVDRSFFYLPYPPPGQWYLSLYAECYPVADCMMLVLARFSSLSVHSLLNLSALCSPDPASTIDVGLVIRSSPCLNYRCRDYGEGASIPPSRVLDPSLMDSRPLNRIQSVTFAREFWRPPWWIMAVNNSYAFQSPLLNLTHPEPSLSGEGLCVELLQHSLFASTCACPPGRVGLGCLRIQSPKAASMLSQLSTGTDGLMYTWNGYSEDALWLALTNLAFLPAICLALLRRLWVPALAYSYTLIFSALYHLCDTDVMNIPIRVGVRTISGGSLSFGGYALTKSRGYRLLNSESIGYRSASPAFRFTSPICLLPLDVLSFCDFFGGVLSVWVTVVAALACPLPYAQLAYVLFVLTLTVAVQVARYSTALFLVPCLCGLILLAYSWILRSRQTGRLFPPIQWWLLSFLPGLLFAGVGVVLFLSPRMTHDYTRVHSAWHILIGLSLLGLLPWPTRWRTALSNVLPEHVPLSCGEGSTTTSRRDQKSRTVGRWFFVGRYVSGSLASEQIFKHLGTRHSLIVPVDCSQRRPSSVNSSSPNGAVVISNDTILKRIIARFLRFLLFCKQTYILTCRQLDVWLELDNLLDALVRRWPACQWLLPHGYIPGRSTHLRVSPILPVSTDDVPPCAQGSCIFPTELEQPSLANQSSRSETDIIEGSPT